MSIPTSIALNSLLVFCISGDFWSTNIPFFRIERRVEKASKIAIEAMMQNIITKSAVVVKLIGFEEIIFGLLGNFWTPSDL